MMRKIFTTEEVIIPDGNGGIRERVPVRVPALKDSRTGDVFLDGDALETLDRKKCEIMSAYAVKDLLGSILAKPTYAKKLSRFSGRQHLAFNISFGGGEPAEIVNRELSLV